jgi:radical SAM protein with 4Fe4S-binding SPASM domain
MEVSKFIIKSELNSDEVLLYSTVTTALIALTKEQYNKVFFEQDFSNNDIVNQLYQLGFLVDNTNQEMQILDKIRKIEIESKIPVVKIFSTNKCNAKCYYCFEDGINPVDMTKKTANQTVAFIKEFYTEKKLQINWFGGEPLLNFQVIKQITLMLVDDGYELETHITTNGSLLTQEMVDFFKKYYSMISVQITIDDINEKYYQIKRYDGLTAENAFNTIVGNAKMLIENGISTRIRINFLKSKIDNAMKVFEYLKPLFAVYESAPIIYLAPLTFDEDNKNLKYSKPKEEEHIHFKLMKFSNERGIVLDKDNEQKKLLASLSLKPKAIPCGSCRPKNLTITAEGHIYKCHRIAKYTKCVIGNVWTGLDAENEYYKVFIDPVIRDNECRVCNVFPICRGGCKVVSTLFDKKNTCEIFKDHSELVKLYYNELVKKQNAEQGVNVNQK